MNRIDHIQPYTRNSSYWQYKGRPVLLLGGSKTDHLFLLDDLKSHLDEIQKAGGNYVRNTMSQREDETLKPFSLRHDGMFDLDAWNDEYWQRFQNMLEWTEERDILVQIEVWDRFDYSQENWHHSPWNPARNVNYTQQATGLAREYPLHPAADVHPFFHTVPGMPGYRPQYDLIRRYQERFVAKMLSYSLRYGHVLYCMNNETSTDPRWGQYWIRFIQARAAEAGTTVQTTDMFDDIWRGQEARHIEMLLTHPELYTFIDISQVNSRNFHEIHWSRLRWLVEQVRQHTPRPVNNTKVYGGNHSMWGSGSNEDGVQRFWRDLLGGCAAARFHRPPSGNGLNDKAKASLAAARLLQTLVHLWDIEPQMERLRTRPDEVYVAAQPRAACVVYFTEGGNVKLDLGDLAGPLTLRWISLCNGEWGPQEDGIPGSLVTLEAPSREGWLAVLTSPRLEAQPTGDTLT